MNPQIKELIKAINELLLKIKPIYKADWSERWKRIENAISALEEASIRKILQKELDWNINLPAPTYRARDLKDALDKVINHWSPK